ncbi:MAG TPA: hypothetical protein VK897_14990 [Anaerolineales bacterium]|nr:hypothetical protein [Anaerolineales bacterium]
MFKRIMLFASLLVLLLTSMCTFYDQSGAVISPNGLSCQTRTDFGFLSGEQSAECYYQCPDGTVRQPEIDGGFSEASPLYSASKDELDDQFCDEPLPTAITQSPATPTAPEAAATTDPATDVPTEEVSPSATVETTTAATATVEVPAIDQPPLLRGDVSMCDVASNLINFRMVESAPDLSVNELEVEIADQNTNCSVNPVNTSLLTCTIPPGVLFPARVVVRLDDAVVNDFIFNGVGCAKIATPFPSLAP